MKTALLLLILLPSLLVAQISETSEEFMQLQKGDSLIFNVGFNTCNLSVLEEITSEDLEFYHDVGGIQNKEEFIKAMAENICSNPDRKITRQLIPGSLEVFLLKKNNNVYGAIQRGEHWFYSKTPSTGKRKTGYAKFSNLWILDNTAWKLSRVYSFDHRAAEE